MRLTQLEIENFKCIGEKQTIDIKPITLLFGPNSAGKSTVFHALDYFRNVLQGNLENFPVHNNDLSKFIRIKARSRVALGLREDLFPINQFDLDGNHLEASNLKNLSLNYIAGESVFSGSVDEVGVAIEINAGEKAPSKIEIEINNQLVLTILKRIDFPVDISVSGTHIPVAFLTEMSKASGKASGHELQINFEHILFRGLDDDFRRKIKLEWKHLDNVFNLNESKKNREKNKREILASQKMLLDEIEEYFENNKMNSPLMDELEKLVLSFDKKHSKLDLYNFDLFKIHEFAENLYCSNKGLEDRFIYFKFAPFSAKSDHEGRKSWESRCSRLQAILVELLAGPIQTIFATTESILHVDALRQVPPSDLNFLKYEDTKDYWKLFNRNDGRDMASHVNSALNSEQISVGYNIELFQSRIIEDKSDFAQIFDDGGERLKKKSDFKKAMKLYKELPRGDCFIKLRDTKSNILLDFKEVGVGVSQLIPVITSIYCTDFGLVTMEQPELHVHPAIQVGIGDWLIQGSTSLGELQGTYLIETHSEHILLRILRRIRETNEGILPKGLPEFTPDEFAVFYVEKHDGQTKFSNLRIDKSGEFIDRWPRGFFEEREEELF